MTQNAPISKVTSATSKPARRYTVETAALLEQHTFFIQKAGYTIHSPTHAAVLTFTRNASGTEADILRMALDVEGVTVQGTRGGNTIRFPCAPRGRGGATSSLRGTVSLGYYPSGQPFGTKVIGATARSSQAAQSAMRGFRFTDTWQWMTGKWPLGRCDNSQP